MYDVLLTCPPMIGMLDTFSKDFEKASFNVTVPDFTQEMSEKDLCRIIGDFDGWIIGDDPVTRQVLSNGKKGKLRACMRWGVGIDNVDWNAVDELQIPIENTPGVFGREVADLACSYVTALLRKTFQIDRRVKVGDWCKPIGDSLWSQRALVVGCGDIGRNLVKRLLAHDMEVCVYDPHVKQNDLPNGVRKVSWPHPLKHVDIVIFTAPLNENTYYMFNEKVLQHVKPGIKLVNVGRGQLVKQETLIAGLKNGLISSAALDVYEVEPYSPKTHKELNYFSDRIILGSHNGSNTKQAVEYVSRLCIKKLKIFLEG